MCEAMIKTIKRLPQYNLLCRAVKAMPIQQPQCEMKGVKHVVSVCRWFVCGGFVKGVKGVL